MPYCQRMLKQKFSDIFRRDKKQKQEDNKRQQNVYFNQTYFECKLAYNPHKLSLIKVIANITVGPDAGMPMMVGCRWLIKKNDKYSEIQGVTSSCYQPCIEDVGCSICVQITPLIEGKTYSGATITKETGPLELGSALQTQFMDLKNKLYYQNTSAEFILKIQAVFGKESSYSNLQYPQDGKLIIRKHQDNNFEIQIFTVEFKTFFWITKQFPTMEFIRKSYNSVVISFTQFQSMRLAFKQNTDREILGLLLRTLTANSTLQWPIKEVQLQISSQFLSGAHQQQEIETQKSQQPPETKQQDQKKMQLLLKDNERILNAVQIQHSIQMPHSPQSKQDKQQEEQHKDTEVTPIKLKKQSQNQLHAMHSAPAKQDSQQTNKIFQLQMKIGDLNTQINKIKKDYKDIVKNYNIEKQNKSKLEHQVKKLNDKIIEMQNVENQNRQLKNTIQNLKEDNRFYKNQISLLNKSIKTKENDLKNALLQKIELQKRLLKFEVKDDQNEISQLNSIEEGRKNQMANWKSLNSQLQEQNQQLKSEIQKLQNSLKTANKKIESLMHEKMIKQQYPKSLPTIPLNDTVSQIAQKNRIINNLQFKLTNLQMLLKHKSNQKGGQSITLHKIINNLTQAITEKEQQLQHTKKINKQLMQKLHKLQYHD